MEKRLEFSKKKKDQRQRRQPKGKGRVVALLYRDLFLEF
jgi:hypothetical protein